MVMCCWRTMLPIAFSALTRVSCRDSPSLNSFRRLQMFHPLPWTTCRSFTRKWSAGGGVRMVTYFWLTSGFPLTRRSPGRASPQWCLIPRRSCATARSSICSRSSPGPRSWSAPCVTTFVMSQAFLNIAKNSQRAMEGQRQQELTVRASAGENSVVVQFIDTGPGVANPEQLFEPFQPGAQASGLGLYLSRTFVRAFQGEIDYQPQATGTCFAITLAMASDRQLRTGESH